MPSMNIKINGVFANRFRDGGSARRCIIKMQHQPQKRLPKEQRPQVERFFYSFIRKVFMNLNIRLIKASQ